MRGCRGVAGSSGSSYSTAGAGLSAAAEEAALLQQDGPAIQFCTHGVVERLVLEKRERDTALPSIISPSGWGQHCKTWRVNFQKIVIGVTCGNIYLCNYLQYKHLYQESFD